MIGIVPLELESLLPSPGNQGDDVALVELEKDMIGQGIDSMEKAWPSFISLQAQVRYDFSLFL